MRKNYIGKVLIPDGVEPEILQILNIAKLQYSRKDIDVKSKIKWFQKMIRQYKADKNYTYHPTLKIPANLPEEIRKDTYIFIIGMLNQYIDMIKENNQFWNYSRKVLITAYLLTIDKDLPKQISTDPYHSTQLNQHFPGHIFRTDKTDMVRKVKSKFYSKKVNGDFFSEETIKKAMKVIVLKKWEHRIIKDEHQKLITYHAVKRTDMM